jgi:DNA-binding IclR family transcriptional regulator
MRRRDAAAAARVGDALYSGLVKVFRILDAFSQDEPEWGVVDLARVTATSARTVSRLLDVMEHAGYVRRVSNGAAYALSLRFTQLGRAAQASYDLVSGCTPFMRELRQRTHGTVVVRILEGAEFVTVAILESLEPVRVSHPVGGRVAYSFGCWGKAMLAFMDPALRHHLLLTAPLRRFTPHTIVDPDRLRAALPRVRANGFALSEEEGVLGTRAVAAPLWNYEQRVIGAIGISFPLSTSSRAAARALGPVVREVAQRLSLHLGARRSTLAPPRRARHAPSTAFTRVRAGSAGSRRTRY